MDDRFDWYKKAFEIVAKTKILILDNYAIDYQHPEKRDQEESKKELGDKLFKCGGELFEHFKEKFGDNFGSEDESSLFWRHINFCHSQHYKHRNKEDFYALIKIELPPIEQRVLKKFEEEFRG